MNLKQYVAKRLETLTLNALKELFRHSFFQAALYQYLTKVQAPNAPRLFSDPYECIGATILTSQTFYENASLEAVKDFLGQQPSRQVLFIDVGANLGNHLVALSDAYDQAIGLEPVKFNVELCKANITYNHLEHKACVHHLALGSNNGNIWIELPQTSQYLVAGQRNNGMFRKSKQAEEVKPANKKSDHPRFHVRMKRGDDFLAPMIDGFGRIVIKIDCEGGEADVIDGLTKLFIGCEGKDFILLLEVLDDVALVEIMQRIRQIEMQSGRNHRLYTIQNGWRDVTNKIKEIQLPQSMLMVTLTQNAVTQQPTSQQTAKNQSE